MSKDANAPEVIRGRIGKIGKDYLLTLVLVDAAKANPLARVSKNFTLSEPIEQVVEDSVNELMGWEASKTKKVCPARRGVGFLGRVRPQHRRRQ